VPRDRLGSRSDHNFAVRFSIPLKSVRGFGYSAHLTSLSFYTWFQEMCIGGTD